MCVDQVPSKFVLPLPLYEPSVYTAHNELRGGQLTLTLTPTPTPTPTPTLALTLTLTLTLNPNPNPNPNQVS